VTKYRLFWIGTTTLLITAVSAVILYSQQGEVSSPEPWANLWTLIHFGLGVGSFFVGCSIIDNNGILFILAVSIFLIIEIIEYYTTPQFWIELRAREFFKHS